MKKKISLIVVYAVLAVVVVGFILCSFIKINFKPEMSMPSLSNGAIEISVSGQAKYESISDTKDYKTFASKFNGSFEVSVLYSLFSGKINNETKIDKVTNSPSFSGYKVQFVYNESQTLKKDGKPVMTANNTNTPITYNRVVFDVQGSKGLTNKNIYFYTNGQTTYYKLTTIANFNGLYKYIANMDMFGE